MTHDTRQSVAVRRGAAWRQRRRRSRGKRPPKTAEDGPNTEERRATRERARRARVVCCHRTVRRRQWERRARDAGHDETDGSRGPSLPSLRATPDRSLAGAASVAGASASERAGVRRREERV